MIARLVGRIVEKNGSSVIVDVSGVGYEVLLSSGDFDRYLLETEAKIYTYHHVREQSEELFGFSSLAAKRIFELLITVQGVGPKAGMAILSISPDVELVRNAIANSDAAFVAKAAGVGKKTAERVVLDLHEKVGLAVAYDSSVAIGSVSGSARRTVEVEVPVGDEALEALMALGYTLNDAVRALAEVSSELSTEERIREALKAGV